MESKIYERIISKNTKEIKSFLGFKKKNKQWKLMEFSRGLCEKIGQVAGFIIILTFPDIYFSFYVQLNFTCF